MALPQHAGNEEESDLYHRDTHEFVDILDELRFLFDHASLTWAPVAPVNWSIGVRESHAASRNPTL
ncbi:hypothetical protein GN958_ATG23027 [Phytophthora infestans]|uniref:Uncharacterized protein n=1 Tax=Phytophthora infestans TaxID=4787 RepID=A0A8S9TGM4_PHYIN|nr:hypothetical protein GN958_ATG23027 [Phytophthora infestans]